MKAKRIWPILLTACLCGCQSQEQLAHVEGENSPQRSSQSQPVHPRAAHEEYAAQWTGRIQMDVENELSQWTPRSYDHDVPMAEIRDTRIDVEGLWTIDSTYDNSTMRLALLPSKHYSVELQSRSCGLAWELKRIAVYHDGVLIFDKPVDAGGLGTFDRLFKVRLDGQPCLLPPRHVARVDTELDRAGVIDASSGIIERCTFGRAGERLAYSDRFESRVNPD